MSEQSTIEGCVCGHPLHYGACSLCLLEPDGRRCDFYSAPSLSGELCVCGHPHNGANACSWFYVGCPCTLEARP